MLRKKHLIVGDGDFSYSVSQLQVSEDMDIITSCIETEAELNEKYHNAPENVRHIKQAQNWKVMFSVDATNLAASFPDMLFAHIQFNFPHCGGKSNIKRNRRLLQEFFISAAVLLEDLNSFVSVALCRGQGGTIFDENARRIWGDCWQVQEAAAAAGLILTQVRPFVYGPAYCPTGFRSQERRFGTEGSLVHVFQPSFSRVEISENPMETIEHDVSCLRHVARIFRMNLPNLEGHPFQRICRQLLEASKELCKDFIPVSLPDRLPAQAIQDPSRAIPLRDLSGSPVAFLPTSPLQMAENLPLNSTGTGQCFFRKEDGRSAFDCFLLIRASVSPEAATSWTRTCLAKISRDWIEGDSDMASARKCRAFSSMHTAQDLALILSKDVGDTLLCFFLNRLAALALGLSDSAALETNDPRLLVEKSPLKGPVSLHPREFLTDMSFWLPTDTCFPAQAFLDAAFAISDGTLQSCQLLERYERSDGRVSHCYRLIFRSLDRALCQGTMHRLQSKLRVFARDNLGVELR